MTILVDENTRVLVQGITGREGMNHTIGMLKYGTKVVAGVTPGREGEKVEGVSVFGSIKRAFEKFPEINTSIIFVPAPFVADSVYEAIDCRLKLIVVISEHVPVHDSLQFTTYARQRGLRIIGPNCPGLISPGESKVGIMPGHIFQRGNVGMVSRSGTLTYEIAWVLTKDGLGQSTAIGIGGDPVIGSDLLEVVDLLEADSSTKTIVIIGEIGGNAEERLAQRAKQQGTKKPIIAFIAGREAPPGKRMGHAGAIISMGSGTAQNKIEALQSSGIPVAKLPSEIPKLIRLAQKV